MSNTDLFQIQLDLLNLASLQCNNMVKFVFSTVAGKSR